MKLGVEGVSKRFGSLTAIEELSFDVADSYGLRLREETLRADLYVVRPGCQTSPHELADLIPTFGIPIELGRRGIIWRHGHRRGNVG